jgi:hypothetical protein
MAYLKVKEVQMNCLELEVTFKSEQKALAESAKRFAREVMWPAVIKLDKQHVSEKKVC